MKHIKKKPGKVLDIQGNIIGKHQGSSFYTIGQRIGPHIGISLEKADPQKRWYISSKKGNTLIASPEGSPELLISNIKVNNVHKFSDIPERGIKARIRHLGKLIPCKINGNTVVLSKPQAGIASGQSIVLYKDSRIIAGGEMYL